MVTKEWEALSICAIETVGCHDSWMLLINKYAILENSAKVAGVPSGSFDTGSPASNARCRFSIRRLTQETRSVWFGEHRF